MSKIGKDSGSRTFFLDGFNGAYKAGAFYRSKTAIDVGEFESKFNVKVVGMVLTTDYDSDKPSWDVEFLTEVNQKDVDRYLKEREEELDKEYLEGKAEVAIENAIKEGKSL